MKGLEEMREWLKERIKQDTEWAEHIRGLEKESEWVQPSSSEIEERIEMYQAILAALADRTDGPSEEKRKEWAELIRDIKNTPEWDWDADVPPMLDEIETFILGNRGAAVMEEFIDRWEGKIVSEVIFQINQSDDEVHPGINIINIIRAMLREAGIETGVAGKEK